MDILNYTKKLICFMARHIYFKVVLKLLSFVLDKIQNPMTLSLAILPNSSMQVKHRFTAGIKTVL